MRGTTRRRIFVSTTFVRQRDAENVMYVMQRIKKIFRVISKLGLCKRRSVSSNRLKLLDNTACFVISVAYKGVLGILRNPIKRSLLSGHIASLESWQKDLLHINVHPITGIFPRRVTSRRSILSPLTPNFYVKMSPLPAISDKSSDDALKDIRS